MKVERARICTVCNALGKVVAAQFVATLPATHLQWFECGEHDAADHGRVFSEDDTSARTLEPLAAWLRKHGLDP